MIIREWRARASLENSEAYPAHFRTRVLPDLAHISGFRGGYLARCSWSRGVEFLVLTHWASMDAIRTFAGDDVDRAVVEPGGVAALVDFDTSVRHYDVIEDCSVPSSSRANVTNDAAGA